MFGRKSGRKPGRRLRLAVGFAAILCVGYGVLSVILSRFLDPEELAGRLEPRLERATNREVQVARVEVGFLPLSVDLVDLTVADPTGMTSALAKARNASFRVALLPLLSKRIDVRRLVLDGFEVDLRVGPGKRSNFGDFSAQSDRPGEDQDPGADSAFSLDLRRIVLRDGKVRYSSETDSTFFEIASLGGVASARGGQEGGWDFEARLDGEVTIRPKDRTLVLDSVPAGFNGSIHASPDFQNLEITGGEGRMGPIRVTLDGTVDGVPEPTRRLALNLGAGGVSVSDLLRFFAPRGHRDLPLMPDGTVGLALSLSGEVGPGSTPTLVGEITVESGDLRTPGGGTLAEAVEGSLTLAEGRSPVLRLQGRGLEGPFTLEGPIDLDRGGAFDVRFRGNPGLSGLQAEGLLPRGMALAGRVEADVRIVGRMDDLPRTRVLGEARPSRFRFVHPSLGVPLEISSGRVRLTGRGASVQDLPIDIAGDRLSVSGEISDVGALFNGGNPPRVWAAVRGARLDLTQLFEKPLPDPSVSYGKIAFARLGGRSVGTRSPEAAARDLGLVRPDSLPVAGSVELSLDTLVDRRSLSADVRARFEFTPHDIRLVESSLRRYGGGLAATGALSLAEGERGRFSFRLIASDLDAFAFLSAVTPIDKIVAGRLNLAADFVGSLDNLLLPDPETLGGTGEFHLAGGSMAKTPVTESLSQYLAIGALREPTVDNWAAPFLVEAGRLLLGEAVLEGAPGNPAVGGAVGLDGALDLRTVFRLPPERLDVGVMDRLSVAASFVEELRHRGELVQASLLVGGHLLAPELSAGAPVQARAVEEAVEERVRTETQTRLEEGRRRLQERAAGFLRGVLGEAIPAETQRGDTLAPDTLRPDTLEPDTLQPDTIRSDSLKPDTLLPDTVRADSLNPDTVLPDTVRADSLNPDTVRSRGPGRSVARSKPARPSVLTLRP